MRTWNFSAALGAWLARRRFASLGLVPVFKGINMASLCLLAEDGALAKRWELGDEPIAVGRGELANVVINDATLSRRHFLIEPENGSYFIKDLASQNGTWV